MANATFIQIQRISDTNKLVAKVVGICHDADLALLEVESASFMKGIKIPAIGDLPARRDRVAVVGFPVGGDEVLHYRRRCPLVLKFRDILIHSAIFWLSPSTPQSTPATAAAQSSAKEKVVGIAFQGLNDADGIGEMVPSPIIKNFLSGIKGSHKMSLPTLGLATQNLENPVLRQQLAMGKADSGILVLKVEYGSSSYGIVQEGDTLLKIGTTKVANNSTVAYRGKHRTRFDVILGEKRVGDTLKLQVLRAGKKKNLSIVLKEKVDLVPRSQYDVTPSYFIFGGLVFQSLCRDYLTTWDNWWEKAPKEFLYLYYSGSRTAQKQETVILSQILADEINVGYEGLYSESVLSVNGKKPKDIRHFVSLVENSVDLVEIRTSSNSRIVFSMKLARARTTPILERYRIERDRSSDLLPNMQAVEQSPTPIKPRKKVKKPATKVSRPRAKKKP